MLGSASKPSPQVDGDAVTAARLLTRIGVTRGSLPGAARLVGERRSSALLRNERKPLQDVFWWLSSDLMQLVKEQLRYDVQAGHEVSQAVGIVRSEGRCRPRFQLRRIQPRCEKADR